MRSMYSFLLYLLMPVVLLYLFFRGLRSRDYLSRWSERFGFFDPPERRGGIWVHAVSMGEVNAAAPLVEALRAQYPDTALCITTFTPTGSKRVRELYGDEVFHVFLPLDLPGAVKRFYNRVQPGLAIIMETEIWPNLLHEAAARGVPSLVANARISDHSLDRYRRFRQLTAQALEQVSRIAAQSERDAGRLVSIGAPRDRVTVTGNLKFDFVLPEGLLEKGLDIRRSWGDGRRVLVAGSTHEKDEASLLHAFGQLLDELPDALLVLVPRHPERFGQAARSARTAGLEVALFSENPVCPAGTNCFVIDAMGELLNYYAAADVAFVGGSFERIGGHNVLEPAALSRPIVAGPHLFNVADISRQLLDAGALVQVQDERELENVLRRLLGDADSREQMGRAGLALVKKGQGAVHRTLAIVKSLFTAGVG